MGGDAGTSRANFWGHLVAVRGPVGVGDPAPPLRPDRSRARFAENNSKLDLFWGVFQR